MARYRKYKRGGKNVPGMYKKQAGGEELTPENSTIYNRADGTQDTIPNSPEMQMRRQMMTPRTPRDPMGGMSPQQLMEMEMLQRQKMMQMQKQKQQQQQQEMMMQMKMQNEMLQQQNELMKTRLEKLDAINSARTVKPMPGAKNSPKKRGGGLKKAKRGKRVIFTESGSGSMMRHGGGMSCGRVLPKGRFSNMRRK